MDVNRREFLASAPVGGLAAALPEAAPSAVRRDVRATYRLLDEAAARPVFKRELFTAPAIIESIELLLSQEVHVLRVYAGVERLFRREPDTLGATVAHAGAEVRSGHKGPVQIVAALDMKTTELHDWSPALSGRAGVEFVRSGASGHPARLVTLMFEIYDGPSPYGQFFQDDISYIGMGVHLSL